LPPSIKIEKCLQVLPFPYSTVSSLVIAAFYGLIAAFYGLCCLFCGECDMIPAGEANGG
jgi:hypothetical protein